MTKPPEVVRWKDLGEKEEGTRTTGNWRRRDDPDLPEGAAAV
jgi:hypothetical protein